MSNKITVENDMSLAQENAALRNKVTVLEEQLCMMQEQFEWLKKQVFGRKTEQTSVIMNEGTQLSMFPEENVQAVSSFSETINVPAHQRKKKRTHDDWMSVRINTMN